MGLTVAIAVVALTCIAGSTDWWKRKIPNWLTVGAFALGLAFHSATQGWVGVRFTLAGFALGFGILFVLWMTGSAGAGDVKLMGALGAWLGTSLILVTHHLADIIPEIDRVVLMKDGQVFFDGPKPEALSASMLSGLYDTTVEVDRRDGYFHAW